MDNYSVRQIRPGHFVKLVNDNVTGTASPGEVLIARWRERHSDIDPGIIEVSLAMTAIFGLIASQQFGTPIRIIAGVGFLASLMASGYLYWAFILSRIPCTLTHYLQNRQRIPLQYWLVLFYPTLALRVLFGGVAGRVVESFEEEIAEFGYLTLLAAYLAIGSIAAVFIIF